MKLPLRFAAHSVAVALLARRSLGGGGWATQTERAKRIGTALPTGKRLQPAAIVHISPLILIASFPHPPPRARRLLSARAPPRPPNQHPRHTRGQSWSRASCREAPGLSFHCLA